LVSEQRFEVPTWSRIYNMLIELADKVRTNCFEPDILVGISRGGWLPTRILSDLLENPYITSVGVEFYVGVYETNREPVLTQPLSVNAFKKKILLVDDVVDTGKSAMLMKSHLIGKGAEETRTCYGDNLKTHKRWCS
jgi:hypoxanthine phosphoribosyltransferase